MSELGASAAVVGIDLGTTHTVVAWTDPASPGEPELFEIPQLVSSSESAPRRLLPSSLYAPLADERVSDPWDEAPWVIGEHARARGGEVPGRAVTSAKSWLCHSGVDRTAPILPWRGLDDAAGPGLPRLSPVDASARLLEHVRRTWDQAHPSRPLGAQHVVLTVPASFDAVARELTVRAAAAAGLAVRLLEEPQAAFYDFMLRGGAHAFAKLLSPSEPSSTVLVCDVGGGTTDLSLIRVRRASGEPPFEIERLAVGRHLLLGGDNMDLALAQLCERRLVGPGEQLDAPRFAQLVQTCRGAKEQLFGDPAVAEIPIAIRGSGSRLVGNVLRTALGREELLRTVVDGFFPAVALSESHQAPRAGIVAFGLPYERDVAITRHIGAFVLRHFDAARPDALLLNGGVFRAAALVDRMAATLQGWLERGEAKSPVAERGLRVLPALDPDVAVARGAVAYGLALLGQGLRIGGGSARGYYIGVGREGEREKLASVCVLPRGAREAVPHRAAGRTLALTVGRPVRFELYAAESGAADRVGSLVELDAQRFERLPPVVATLPAQSAAQPESVLVELVAELSAIGTLELGCVEQLADGSREPRRFALAFDLRGGGDGPERRSLPPASAHGAGKRWGEAREQLDRVFGKERSDVPEREVKGLVRALEKTLGPRDSWTTELNRALYDALWPNHRARRRSADHERVFWSLGGYCLRPGIGDPRDAERVGSLAKLFEQGLLAQDPRTWPQFWIAWRRVAAGLGEDRQLRIRDAIDPFLAPGEQRLKKPKLYRNDAVSDMLDLGGGLERVPAARRRELGSWVLERTWTDRDPRLWAAIGRIGARVPTYGSVHQVVPGSSVERWVDHLLRERWQEIPTAARAAVALCRVTNDRARDLSPKVRQEVALRLEQLGSPQAYCRAVLEFVPPSAEDREAFYGEGLPVGLQLVDADG